MLQRTLGNSGLMHTTPISRAGLSHDTRRHSPSQRHRLLSWTDPQLPPLPPPHSGSPGKLFTKQLRTQLRSCQERTLDLPWPRKKEMTQSLPPCLLEGEHEGCQRCQVLCRECGLSKENAVAMSISGFQTERGSGTAHFSGFHRDQRGYHRRKSQQLRVRAFTSLPRGNAQPQS